MDDRQCLSQITGQDEYDSPKRSLVSSYVSESFFKNLEHFLVGHRAFVPDDEITLAQHLGPVKLKRD